MSGSGADGGVHLFEGEFGGFEDLDLVAADEWVTD